MVDTLRIKRRAVGGAAGAPSSLAAAEIAYNEQDDTLYYGKGNSGGSATSIIPIAGPGKFAQLASPVFTGTLTTPNLNVSSGSMSMAGIPFAGVGGTYTVIYEALGTNAALILGQASEPSNYYRNGNHLFQSMAASTFCSINSGGISLAVGYPYRPGGGLWIDSSDARIKDVVGDYTHGLKEVIQLTPRRFTYKGNDVAKSLLGPTTELKNSPTPHQQSGHYGVAVSGKEFIGLIAQEAEVSMPELVTQVEGYIDGGLVTDLRELDSTALIFALVNAVKELAAKVAALESFKPMKDVDVSNTSYDVSEHGPMAQPRYGMSLLTVDEFHRFWPKIEEMLDAVPHTWKYWTKDAIYASVGNGTLQAWGIGPPETIVLMFLTSVHIFPAMRVFSVLWAAGMFEDEMAPLLDATFNDYAKLNNCTEISVTGRFGWEPQLKRVGFKRESHTWNRLVYTTRMN